MPRRSSTSIAILFLAATFTITTCIPSDSVHAWPSFLSGVFGGSQPHQRQTVFSAPTTTSSPPTTNIDHEMKVDMTRVEPKAVAKTKNAVVDATKGDVPSRFRHAEFALDPPAPARLLSSANAQKMTAQEQATSEAVIGGMLQALFGGIFDPPPPAAPEIFITFEQETESPFASTGGEDGLAGLMELMEARERFLPSRRPRASRSSSANLPSSPFSFLFDMSPPPTQTRSSRSIFDEDAGRGTTITVLTDENGNEVILEEAGQDAGQERHPGFDALENMMELSQASDVMSQLDAFSSLFGMRARV